MAWTKDGSKAAAKTNKAKFGEDFYRNIGSMGGKKGTTGGFWHKKYVQNDVEAVREAGKKGGAMRHRGKVYA